MSTRITLKFMDIEGQTITVPFFFDETEVATLVAAQSVLAEMEPLVEAVSGAALVGAVVEFPLAVASIAIPEPGYSVYTGATLSFYNDAGASDSFYLPSILGTFINNNVVSRAGSMDTLITALADAGLGTGNWFPVTRAANNKWRQYSKGYRTTRKARR